MTYRSWGAWITGWIAIAILGSSRVLPAAAAAAAAPAAAPAPVPAVSQGDRVNVRSRPGFAGEVITQLKKGQSVLVLETITLRQPATNEPPAWLRIRLPENSPAWVAAELVDLTNKTVRADVLNVRAGPSYDHASIARLKHGTPLVTRGEVKDGWLPVVAPAQAQGFVPASFLTLGVSAPPTPAAPPPAPAPAAVAAPKVVPATNIAPAASSTPAKNSSAALSVTTPAPAPSATTPIVTNLPAPVASASTPPPGAARAVPSATNATVVVPAPASVAAKTSTNTAPPTAAPKPRDEAWFKQFTPAPTNATVAAPAPAPVPPTATKVGSVAETPLTPSAPRTIPATALNPALKPAPPPASSKSSGAPATATTKSKAKAKAKAKPVVAETPEPPKPVKRPLRGPTPLDGTPAKPAPSPATVVAAEKAAVVPPLPPAEPVPEPPPAARALDGLDDPTARLVRREGLVVRPFDVQSPSFFALQSRDSGEIVNFLVTTRPEPLSFREYRGKVVIITGREYLDRRRLWRGVPLLNVETIEAVR